MRCLKSGREWAAVTSAMDAFKAWKDTPEKIFGGVFNGGSIAAEINPALLGVGYIIGPRIASIMCAGGVLAYLVLIPMIKFFGENMAGVVAPGARLVSVKVAGADGVTSLVRVLMALDWVRRNRTTNGLNIRVLNLSFGVDARRS